MGIIHSIVTLCLLGAGVTSAPAQDENVIVNYWQHIQEIAKEEARKKPPVMPSNSKYVPPQRFPFEAYRHLKAKDLLRAAREGVEEARRLNYGKPKEVVDHRCLSNVQFALEYYPLLARDVNDANALIEAMEQPNDDIVLRTFLLQSSAAGPESASLLSTYMFENFVKTESTYKSKLLKMIPSILDPTDAPALAAESLYAFLVQEYRMRLKADPQITQFAKDAQKELVPMILREQGCPKPASRTSVYLKELDRDFDALLNVLKRVLDPKGNYTDARRSTARQIVSKIFKEIPLNDAARQKAQLLLETAAPQPLKK